MRRKRWLRGFTMAELLAVVGIIAVLGGVSVIAVHSYQKSLTQRERNTIAKEIFIAAQNHLTMAESQGFLGAYKEDLGTKDSSSTGVYYFQYNTDEYAFQKGEDATETLLDQMLPMGSIDEFTRTGGNSRYVIRYQLEPAATVLDVGYWSANEKDNGGELGYSQLSGFFGKTAGGAVGSVLVGWYGGSGPDISVAGDVSLESPTMVVKNAERLIVEVTDTNASKTALSPKLKLIVKGESSGAQMAIELSSSTHKRYTGNGGKYTVVLDDITTAAATGDIKDGLHFADLNLYYKDELIATDIVQFEPGKQFKPGENITVKAVAYSADKLTNIAYSNEWTTNSLFADLVTDAKDNTKKNASISNIRHLENLDEAVSGVDNANNKLFAKAVQTADLVWKDTTGSASATAFTTLMGKDVQIYKKEATEGTGAGNFLPVSPTGYSLVYDGLQSAATPSDAKAHSITGVVVNSPNAGLFGAPEKALTVSNLELVDFSITGTTSAGTLAGTLTIGSSVTNVLARNSTNAATATIISTSGNAGGLIGSMTGTTVDKCAAALIVSGKTNAGGLVGWADGGKIENSYSGGHTTDGKYTGKREGDAGKDFNVTATENAGGLIGNAIGANISNSYATCSASGKYAGGLAGLNSGSISNSYATGLVYGSTKQGAFVGSSLEGASYSSCQYYEVINEMPIEDGGTIKGYQLMKALGSGNGTNTNITAFDATAASYNSFCDTTWASAEVYDSTLTTYYNDGAATPAACYPLKAIQASTESGSPSPFVATHYGDWPAPEIFVENAK